MVKDGLRRKEERRFVIVDESAGSRGEGISSSGGVIISGVTVSIR